MGQIQLMDIQGNRVWIHPMFHAHTTQVAVRFVELLENSKTENTSSMQRLEMRLSCASHLPAVAIEQMDAFPELPGSQSETWARPSTAGICMKIEEVMRPGEVMPVVTTIKLTGDNHQDVDLVCQQIRPFPTRRE